MKRPNVDFIKQKAETVPDFDMFTEEDGISIECAESDTQAVKDYIGGADSFIISLIKWIEYLEDEIDIAGIHLDRP